MMCKCFRFLVTRIDPEVVPQVVPPERAAFAQRSEWRDPGS
jgi:hypothetical protein